MPIVWKITAKGPDHSQIESIATILNRGGVILAPTDTIYGLHALADNEAAVNRVFELKGRPAEKALPVLFASLEQVRDSGIELSPEVEATLEQIWPAPLTAVLPLPRPLAASAGAPTLAVRVPAVEWLRSLMIRTGPLASTSANRSGEPAIVEPRQLPQEIQNQLDGIFDSGPLNGAASTIVDFTRVPPEVVRPGEFLFTQNLWKKSRKSL